MTYRINAQNNRSRRAVAVLAAILVVVGGLLAQSAKPAEAAFPGLNGRIVFESNRTTGEGVDNPEGDFEIFSMNPDGTGIAHLTHNSHYDGHAAYSPYGNKIAYVSDYEIYVMKPDGTDETRLTNNGVIDTEPAFSPDIERIAFTRYLPGGVGGEVYVMDADGTDAANVTQSLAEDDLPAFSLDGSKIVFVSNRDGDDDIYKMRADGAGAPINLTHNAVSDGQPAYSPGGRKIAFVSGEEVYSMKADDTAQTALTLNPAIDYRRDWQPLKIINPL